MSVVDDKLKGLSPEKKAFLEKLLREKKLQQAAGGPKIEPITLENNRYPLTFAQEKIWIANSINPEAAMYNVIGVARIQGNVRMLWFKEALKESFLRHEILRMHFKEEDGELYAEIDEEMVFLPEILDLSHESQSREAILETTLNRLAKKPFALEKDTLIRATLIRTAPKDWTVIIVVHHIVGDSISVNIILGETLVYCYNKLNDIEKLPPLAIQFKDFAWWKRNKEDESLHTELAKKYWDDKLNGADFSLDILKEEQDLTHFDEAALRTNMLINAEVVKKIQQIAGVKKITVFNIYFAVLKLLIYKYSMQKDLMIGVIIAGRDLIEVQPMVGCFVDILPIRSEIDEELTFDEFLRDSYGSFLESYEKRDAYFGRGDSPIYQLLFNYKETPESDDVFEELEIHSHEVDNGFSRASMDFELIKSGEAVEGGISYRKGALDEEFVKGFINRYYMVLDKMIDEEGSFFNKKIKEIEIIDDSERQQVLIDFNATKMAYPNDKTVIQMFEEQVAKAPDNIAMNFQGRSMTYGELNAKANIIAKRLRYMGIRPGDYVAMMTSRSMELVIGIYGIIKSGGAYVPIDIDCPKGRLSYMLADCSAKAMLVYGVDIDAFELEITTIDLADKSIYQAEEEEKGLDTTKEMGLNLPIVNTAEDDLYLIYTSGTTGEPKGVMCQHKGTVNLISYLQQNYPIGNESTDRKSTRLNSSHVD
jgi:hypothetical protein